MADWLPPDVGLAQELKGNQSEWDKLSTAQRQWIDMLIGANLSSEETRAAAIEVFVNELTEIKPVTGI